MRVLQYRRFAVIFTGVISALFLLMLAMSAHAEVTADKSAAVIFAYQRIGEDSVPQGNISLEKFVAHLTELEKGGYQVLPLPEIIDAVKKAKSLPGKAVAITFDGASASTLLRALPLLEARKMPYTVFFAADAADQGGAAGMDWRGLKNLRKNKLATLGILPASYAQLTDLSVDESAALINRAVARYREMLGSEPAFFAYPYGEYSLALKKRLIDYHFAAAFGLQSGAIHTGSDFLALPRFTMTGNFGDADRFLLTANALPLPISDIVPEDTLLSHNPPLVGFTVSPEITNLSRLSCFASSGAGKLSLAKLSGNRVEIRPDQPFTERRTRINCTLPNAVNIPGEPKSWRWVGLLFIAPDVADVAPSGDNNENEESEDNIETTETQ